MRYQALVVPDQLLKGPAIAVEYLSDDNLIIHWWVRQLRGNKGCKLLRTVGIFTDLAFFPFCATLASPGMSHEANEIKKSKTMNEVLSMLVVFGSITTVILMLTKFITEYRLKKLLIEKGYVDKEAQFFFHRKGEEQNSYSSLKWGLVIFFGGLSLVVIEFIPVSHDSPLPYGLFALSVAVGFLIYYFLTRGGGGKKTS